jgi:hypothetical protein
MIEPKKKIRNSVKKKTVRYVRRRELEKLTPAEWVGRLNRVPSRARAAVARVIWWDFFSQRTVAERWSHLDEMIQGPDVPGTAIRYGLKICGFTDKMANSRVSGKE